jgi:NAD dependent epimerase/dehydratase family enzyme
VVAPAHRQASFEHGKEVSAGKDTYSQTNGQGSGLVEQKPANDFLGLTCQKWEAVAMSFKEKVFVT